MSARGSRKARRSKDAQAWWESLWLSGLLQLVLAIYLGISLTGPVGSWWSALHGEEVVQLLPAENPGGPVGSMLSLALHAIFGAAWCWLAPILLVISGLRLLARQPSVTRPLLFRLLPLWLATTTWIAQPGGLLVVEPAAFWGGLCGVWLGRGCYFLVGLWGMRLFLTLFVIVAIGICCHPWLASLLAKLPALRWSGFGAGAMPGRFFGAVSSWGRQSSGMVTDWTRSLLARFSWGGDQTADVNGENGGAQAAGRQRRLHGVDQTAGQGSGSASGADAELLENPQLERSGLADDPLATAGESSLDPATPGLFGGDLPGTSRPAAEPDAKSRPVVPKRKPKKGKVEYELPALSLLHVEDGPALSQNPAELDASADLLEETLRSFGVVGEVKDVRPGPVVTTFEYQPAAGIKVNQITQRADDLALAMKARSVRMEAP
ncbi:MAG: DNA translocase FtsK, partial [bacterium]